MLYLTEQDVRDLLPMPAAIARMAEVFAHLADGSALNQPRRRLVLPTEAVLHQMAGADGRYFGTKIYSTHRRHGAWFFFLLYRSDDARPLAVMEANYLGQIRTGAASGYATGVMAPAEAATVGVIGSGFQARTQIEAMCAVRTIREIRVWSRSADRRHALADEAGRVLGLRITAVESAEAAVQGADIVVTATNAKDPVLEAGWVAPTAHVNAMGSNQASRRELPSELIARASLIAVDSLEQSRLESGDLLLSEDRHHWAADKIVELQDVKGTVRKGITIFKSNGLAVEDVAAAAHVYEEALGLKRGREFYS